MQFSTAGNWWASHHIRTAVFRPSWLLRCRTACLPATPTCTALRRRRAPRSPATVNIPTAPPATTTITKRTTTKTSPAWASTFPWARWATAWRRTRAACRPSWSARRHRAQPPTSASRCSPPSWTWTPRTSWESGRIPPAIITITIITKNSSWTLSASGPPLCPCHRKVLTVRRTACACDNGKSRRRWSVVPSRTIDALFLFF